MNARTLTAYVLLVLVATFGLFFNLGDRLLWGDEATTALLALNITKYGVPKATDGKNEITFVPGHGDWSDDELYIWSPWLGEYLAAGSFLAFGQSTTTARFPFVLIALASVILLAVVAYRTYRNHELALTAVLFLVTSVPFFLLSRQCRYYALLLPTQILILYGFHQLVRGKTVSGIAQIGLSLTAQFYANYIVVPGNVVGLCLAAAIVVRRERRVLWAMPMAFLVLGIFTVPWLLYTPPTNQLEKLLDLGQIDDHLAYCLSEIHFHLVPLPLLMIPSLAWLFSQFRAPAAKQDAGLTSHAGTEPISDGNLVTRLLRKVKARADVLASDSSLILWCLLFGQVAVLSITLPMVFFRYLCPLIPLLMLLAAVILNLHVRPVWLRRTLVLLLASSNVIAVAIGFPFRGEHRFELPMLKYVRSITSPYSDRFEDFTTYLKREAHPGQTVYVANPEHPLIFYTNLRVVDARFHRQWPDPLPDWVLPVSPSAAGRPRDLALPASLLANYELIRLPVHDSPRGANRPDPHAHAPFTVSQFTDLNIYKKRPTPP
jgi:4-amino-4-deoxy-L-arabinose transferase-like glycosyltransferase